jgi:hypothetical protein
MPCEVPECPAVVGPHERRCAVHRDAAPPKVLGCLGATCVRCGRAFRDGDLVSRTRVRYAYVGKAGGSIGYAHVACAPTRQKPDAAADALPFE